MRGRLASRVASPHPYSAVTVGSRRHDARQTTIVVNHFVG